MLFRSFVAPALLGATLLGACADNPAAAPDDKPAPRAIGLVEITVSGIGTPQMSASVSPVGGASSGARANLTPIPGGTPAGSIQFERVSATTVDVGTRGAGGKRYIQAVFRVRNADASGNAYNTPRQNLTFLPAGIAGTISGTPVSGFRKQDGTAADASIASHLMPTGAVTLDGGGALVSQYPDVLQAYTETEASAFDMPGAVTNKLPYGFVVRNVNDNTTRTLPANPAVGQFDGRVTFAYSVPLAATAAEDPFTISIVAVAMDDPETRVTQSVEEQTSAGQLAFETRVSEIGAGSVTLLQGGNYTGTATKRMLCDVRVSGTSGSMGDMMGKCPVDTTPAGLSILCHANVSNQSVNCDASSVVVLTPSNVTASAGTLQFDMTVQSLIPEGMGTPDGVITDTAGIRLVLPTDPSITAGSGSVSLANADGVTPLPYILYNQKLSKDQISGAETWQFSYSPGVTSFDFRVRVTATLQPLLIINELLVNPGGTITDANGEWFELYNAGHYAVQMENLVIADSAASGRRPYHRISTPLTVNPGGYVVFGNTTNTTNNGGVAVDYAYGSALSFANSLDALKVARVYGTDTLTIDRTQYSSAATSAVDGVGRELKNPALDNSNMDGSNWAAALATAVYGPGGRGTPKAQNSTYVP